MNNNSLDFVKEYPRKWYIQPENVNWKSNQHYNVLYSSVYRELLNLYNQSDRNKEAIKKYILDVLENKILVDLWCGSYAENLAAVAYQSNAQAYIGIDVHADITEYDDEKLKSWLREQYHLSEDIKLHNTITRKVFDNFENFLKRAPDQAWYNFTINGLALTNSIQSIKLHLQRIMLPGNIVLANTLENINILDVLIGPHKHTKIENVGSDSLHIYEKLDDKTNKLTETIQESITITLK